MSWWHLPGYLWSLPNTLLGLLLCAVYRVSSVRWSQGCLEVIGSDRIWGRPAAQTWGCVIFYRNEETRSWSPIRVHERVHVVQGFVLGPLFLVAYGAHFLWLFALQGFSDWQGAYRRIWAERQAYRIQDEYEAGERPGAWGS